MKCTMSFSLTSTPLGLPFALVRVVSCLKDRKKDAAPLVTVRRGASAAFVSKDSFLDEQYRVSYFFFFKAGWRPFSL